MEEPPHVAFTYLRTRIYLQEDKLVEKGRLVKYLGEGRWNSPRYPEGSYIFQHVGHKKSRYICGKNEWPVLANPSPSKQNPDHFIIYKRQ